ncbi:MAG: hypothetical protein ACI8RZ_000486 [Myxococcota bacterium]|jgi:hypothetical protein
MMRWIVGGMGVFFVLVAVGWVVAPELVAEGFSISLTGADGRSTARSDLGGFFGAMGAFCLLGSRGEVAMLKAAVISLGIIAVLRVVSMVLDGASLFTGAALAVELVGVGLLVLAIRTQREG